MFSKKIKWVKLADTKESLVHSFLPTGLKKITLEGKTICLVHFEDKLFAMNDRCPHQSASLSAGSCTQEGFVVCPWHRYGFDIRNGRGPGYYSDTYEVQEREDGVFIGIKKGWLEI